MLKTEHICDSYVADVAISAWSRYLHSCFTNSRRTFNGRRKYLALWKFSTLENASRTSSYARTYTSIAAELGFCMGKVQTNKQNDLHQSVEVSVFLPCIVPILNRLKIRTRLLLDEDECTTASAFRAKSCVIKFHGHERTQRVKKSDSSMFPPGGTTVVHS